MKLKQFLLKNFDRGQVLKEEKEEKEIFKALDQYLGYVFPLDLQDILDNLRKIDLSDKDKFQNEAQKFHNLNQYSLQFHTQDNDWLAVYLNKTVSQVKYFRQSVGMKPVEKSGRNHIPFPMIQKYVATSPRFAQARDLFAQTMVKACIIMHKNDEEDFICNKEHMDERNDIIYDQLFRNDIVDALSYVGLSKHNIEKGIELNQNLWVKDVRRKTFENCYANGISDEAREALSQTAPKTLNKFDSIKEDLFNQWNLLRDHSYYKVHQDVIDTLGTTRRPGMNLNTKKKQRLLKNVSELRRQYHDCLETLVGKSAERN